MVIAPPHRCVRSRKPFCPLCAGKRLSLLRDLSGSAVIEFAFVAPVLIAMLVAITQTALVFLAQQGLETAAEQAGRLIMTGQVEQ